MKSGNHIFLELLRQEGVEVMFGNPGTTELKLMDGFASDQGMRYVVALQESIAVGMADGYARASGKLGVLNLHAAPGLGNGTGLLYDAQRAGTPLLVTAGQQAQGFGLMEPNLYAELPPIAQPYVKWAVEARSARELPRIIHRAAKTALSPPTGPVFVSLPGDVMSEMSDVELGSPTRIGTRFTADAGSIETAARLLASASAPMIIAGDGISHSDAQAELVELAELLGAPVYIEGEPSTNSYPTTHGLFRGHLVRSAKVIRGVLEKQDVLFSACADLFTLSLPPEVDCVPPGLDIVHMDENAWEIGKNFPASGPLWGDAKATLPLLTRRVRELMGPAEIEAARSRREKILAENARALQALTDKAEALSGKSPVAVLTAMKVIGDVVPKNAIVIEETVSSSQGLREFLKCDGPRQLFGVRGGGIGWGLPAAIGAKLACPDQPVIALVGDGSAMFSIQALWSAAHAKTPVVFIILNNRSYRVLKQRLFALGGHAAQVDRYVGMDFTDPPIDFCGVATSLGLKAARVDSAEGLRSELAAALEQPGPVLIELMLERDYK